MEASKLPIFSVIRLKKELMLLGEAFGFSSSGASGMDGEKMTAGYITFECKRHKFQYDIPYLHYESPLISTEDMSKHMQDAYKLFKEFKTAALSGE